KKDNNKSTTPTGEYYIKGTLNGTTFDWEETDGNTNWVTGSASAGSSDQGVFTGDLMAQISAIKGFQPVIGVDFRTLQVSYEQDKSAYFNSFVNTGPWAYAKSEDYTVGTKNIIIYYTDSNGKQYSTIGTETGNINVVSVIKIAADFAQNERLKIKVVFSCTLYPTDGTGDAIKLTNVDATLRLEDLIPL